MSRVFISAALRRSQIVTDVCPWEVVANHVPFSEKERACIGVVMLDEKLCKLLSDLASYSLISPDAVPAARR